MMKGNVDPPYVGSDGTALSSVECLTNQTGLALGCAEGIAQGSGFTVWSKKECFLVCDKIKVTFTADDGTTHCVWFSQPGTSTVARLVPEVTTILSNYESVFQDFVYGRNGQVSTAFNGPVTVIPGSLRGSWILIDRAGGTTTVETSEGVGAMSVRTVNGIPGDKLTFDMFADGHLGLQRSILTVH